MPTTTADIETPEASRLIKRLCTHWAHKLELSFDDTRATVPFDATTTTWLRADDRQLHVRVEAADAATVERFQGVVESHLQRMARAGELVVHWRNAEAGSTT